MPGIFKESAAPYLLALIVTLVGWMFNSAIDNAKNLLVIQYSMERGKDGTVDTLTVRIRNQSLTQPINIGKFNFVCPLEDTAGIKDISPCLVQMPSVSASGQFLGSANFTIISPVTADIGSATAPARVPPGAEAAYRFGVKDKETKLRFRYLLSDDDITKEKPTLQLKIIDGDNSAANGVFGWVENLTLFIISNYLSVLVLVILFLLTVIVLWIIVATLAALLKRPAPRKEPERYQVEITHKDENYVATIHNG